MEIITGVERRRRWSVEEKLRLVAECDAPGSSVTRVSRQHDINRALLWTWRRQVRRGELGGETDRGFLAVTLPTLPWVRHCSTGARTRDWRLCCLTGCICS
ncbi:transposase [Acetobacter indonesiensis]|uniref:transposase n=1 Tax=Acetobacter indonesiensis TaxID=104101 RepID=UPI0039E9BE5B